MDTLAPTYLRRALCWLVLTTLVYFLLNGAQILETAMIVPAWTAAPPSSLALFHGAGGLDLQAFWIVFHSVHELTFLLAIAFVWKVRAVRRALLLLFAAHLAVRAWTLAYFAPSIIRFQAIPPSGPVDEALRAEAVLWQDLNYTRVALFVAVSMALLPLVALLARRCLGTPMADEHSRPLR